MPKPRSPPSSSLGSRSSSPTRARGAPWRPGSPSPAGPDRCHATTARAAHRAIFHLLQEPVPALADPFPRGRSVTRRLPSSSSVGRLDDLVRGHGEPGWAGCHRRAAHQGRHMTRVRAGLWPRERRAPGAVAGNCGHTSRSRGARYACRQGAARERVPYARAQRRDALGGHAGPAIRCGPMWASSCATTPPCH